MKDNKNNSPHFVIVPFMAQGHIIPILDMARLLADRGAIVSFITTPINAARIRPIIDRIHNSSIPIHFVELRFPSAEVGLPDGCDNFDLITSEHLVKPFLEAIPLLAPQLESYLRQSSTPKVDCIITDNINYWTVGVARRFGVPRLVFHGPSCFYIYCITVVLRRGRMLDGIEDDFEAFELPEMSQRIEVTKAQVTRWAETPAWDNIREEFYAGEEAADGIVINTFQELEPWYVESYRKAIGKKVWTIGPVSGYNKERENQASRGNPSSIDTQILLQWLNGKATNSVILVSFGSIARDPLPQLIEIGHALQASEIPFIWVVKETADAYDVDTWMSQFEERTQSNGLVIRGWAPQAVILSHEAVGGFMTHCGWNSTLESIAAGVPMVTWPRFADQFLNERLVVDVLRVGVAVGVKEPTKLLAAEEEVRVRRERVEEAVRRLMGGGEEAEERWKRVRELRIMAGRAMEDGGSSSQNLNDLIEYAACRI